jgi:D-alanyl-lipoteichoic acid acyltransferase DltB (MBOAT superfamily)
LAGALRGLYQTIEIFTQKMRDKVVKKLNIDDHSTFTHKTFQDIFTFGLVSFAWLFFKANSISEAVHILKSIITLDGITTEEAWIFKDGSLGLDDKDFWMMTHTLLILLVVEFIQRKHDLLAAFNK